MNLQTLFSERRIGSSKIPTGIRSGFQRDYDRLIFSSAFRRLQNKTQVFPLPGTAFVHNRLTHSLEVASVGRSLGKMVGEKISQQFPSGSEAYEFYKYELSNVIAAACLAHDIGNPAFGHSGESAISSYFIEHADEQIGGRKLKEHFSLAEWTDLTNFEGNANAIRVLTHSFRGRFRGGFGLTYTTIASILKYPCESTARDKQFRHRKKYGFFQSEKNLMHDIAECFELAIEQADPLVFCRHPFVYLVEAADDICYNIVDMEDAQRLGILDRVTVEEAFMQIIREVGGDAAEDKKVYGYYRDIQDTNEAIAFLRAKVINVLTVRCAALFYDHLDAILAGAFNETLTGIIRAAGSSLQTVMDISLKKIYQHEKVIQIEIAGYNVMSELLKQFVPSLLTENRSAKQDKILKLFPYQFTQFEEEQDGYPRVMNALDFLSGMTDEYATELYRRLTGISIPAHR